MEILAYDVYVHYPNDKFRRLRIIAQSESEAVRIAEQWDDDHWGHPWRVEVDDVYDPHPQEAIAYLESLKKDEYGTYVPTSVTVYEI